MSPEQPIVVITEQGRPRPSHDAFHHEGMAIAVGGISIDDEVYSLRLTYVVNNLIRGAAGGAILNAEVFYAMFGEDALKRAPQKAR
jgi:aspartate-semialdehyde dehydrogenase